MSMLVEPKNKCKYSINPRGLDWVNDDSKFGQKLMEKMGWSKGQGLGVKKDGNTDHIHVSVKVDKRGVGCSRKSAEEWLDHQDSFSDLLNQLNAEHVDSATRSKGAEFGDGELLSLEHKSKNSSCRVHYQKFTKSKDLSNKNSKDLDCIFGIKARVNKLYNNCIPATDETEKYSSDFGVKTSTSTLSSSEYFSSKLLSLNKKYRNAEKEEKLNNDEGIGNKNLKEDKTNDLCSDLLTNRKFTISKDENLDETKVDDSTDRNKSISVNKVNSKKSKKLSGYDIDEIMTIIHSPTDEIKSDKVKSSKKRTKLRDDKKTIHMDNENNKITKMDEEMQTYHLTNEDIVNIDKIKDEDDLVHKKKNKKKLKIF